MLNFCKTGLIPMYIGTTFVAVEVRNKLATPPMFTGVFFKHVMGAGFFINIY